jgi:hypothetical protein
MSDASVVDLFVEDRAHEEFIKAMISRLAEAENKEVRLRVRSARGGHGQAIESFVTYQRVLLKGLSDIPDLLVVCIDANCSRFNDAKRSIDMKIKDEFTDRTVVACPDPHIERWFMADLTSFQQVIGVAAQPVKKKCERAFYKTILAKAIIGAGYPPTLGGVEFAKELVDAMDLYRAGRAERSLGLFLDDAVPMIRSL